MAKSKNTGHNEHVDNETERRRRRPRRGFVPQAQAAQQRLQHATMPSAPPRYGQVTNSSKIHRPEGYLASVPMKLVILTLFLCSSADLFLICRVFFCFCDSVSSPQATVWAPAWAPPSRTCEHVDNGASTPEATPRLYAAGAGGATTATTCDCAVCAAKPRPSL
jgi:hypothetical protein